MSVLVASLLSLNGLGYVECFLLLLNCHVGQPTFGLSLGWWWWGGVSTLAWALGIGILALRAHDASFGATG